MSIRFHTPDSTLRHADDVAVATLASELALQLAPSAAHYDSSGEFPHAHLALLRERRALALTIPQTLGGRGLSLYQTLLFQERLSQGSAPTALCLGWHLMALACLGHQYPQRQAWPADSYAALCQAVVQRGDLVNLLITDRAAGNLLRGARSSTVAQRTPEGFVLSGRKAFCSAAPALQHLIVYAWVEDEQRMAEFWVPKSERTVPTGEWNTLGMRSTASVDIEFHNVELPTSALQSYIDPGRISTFTVASKAYGLQLSAVYLGIAIAARDAALEFAHGYTSASLGGSILDAPLVQHKLGEIEFVIHSAKTQLYGLAQRWESNPSLQEQMHDEVAVTKVAVIQSANRAVELAVSIVGGHALSKALPLERHLRDVRCGLHNPPQEDVVWQQLAKGTVERYRLQHTPHTVAAQAA